jgi:signal peptide peptidase SppA
MNKYPHLMSRIFGTPLMISQGKLDVILAALAPRLDLQGAGQIDANGPYSKPADRKPYAVTSEGIAVISIVGSLVKRVSGLDAISGLTSYEQIETEFLDAATDPAIKGILLDIDSPGGEAAGVFDLSDQIYQARTLKPVWAMANEMAFSAAYALGSAAEHIWVSRTSGVGSVGVLAVHLDTSGADQKAGLKYSTIFAGDRKTDFDSHAPLSEEAKSTLQDEVNRVYDIFVETVSRNRNLSADQVRKTEAALFWGEQGLQVGLADKIGTLPEALTAMGEKINRPQGFSRMAAKGGNLKMNVLTQTQKEEPATGEGKGELQNDPVKETGTGQKTPPQAEGQESPADPAKPEEGSTVVGEIPSIAGAEHFAKIAELCQLAGLPNMAPGLIRRGMSLDDAKRLLLAARAASDPQITSFVVSPAQGTRSKSELENSPVVKACEAMAAQKK